MGIEAILRKNPYTFLGQPDMRETQINTTKRYHFPPVRIAILTKCKHKKCRRGHGEKGTLLS